MGKSEQMYQPTPEDIAKAEGSMTDRDKAASEIRVENMDRLREHASKLGFELNTEKLEFKESGSRERILNFEGTVKGHKLRFNEDGDLRLHIFVDGVELQASTEEQKRISGELWKKYAFPILKELSDKFFPSENEENFEMRMERNKQQQQLAFEKASELL